MSIRIVTNQRIPKKPTDFFENQKKQNFLKFIVIIIILTGIIVSKVSLMNYYYLKKANKHK